MPKHATLETNGKLKSSQIPSNVQVSNVPSGMCRVTNIYVNPTTGKLVIEYNDVPEE